MAGPDTERLSIILDVADHFTGDILKLLTQLEIVEDQVRRLDGENIDLNTTPAQRALATVQGQMAELQARSAAGVGVPGATGGGGGAGGAAARGASEAADGFIDSIRQADIRMTDLHNALAKAVPLLFIIIGALPALIGGLTALATAALGAAAALAAVTGLGAIGFAIQQGGPNDILGGLTDALSEIRDAFLDAFMPLAQRLAPLFEDALAGLEVFFQRLADRGDTLQRFAALARDFGGFLLDFLPNAIQALGEMAIAFRGVFGMLADSLQDMNLTERLTGFMAAVLPEFTRFFELVVALIPKLARMSIGFLRVTNIIIGATLALAHIAGMLGLTAERFGTLVAGILAAITALFIWNSTAIAGAVSALASLGASIIRFIGGSLVPYISSLSAATVATWSLNTALATLIGLLTLGIGTVAAAAGITALMDKFSSFKTDVSGATDALREFNRVGNRVGNDSPYGFGGEGPRRGSLSGAGGTVNIRIEGNADRDDIDRLTNRRRFADRRGT